MTWTLVILTLASAAAAGLAIHRLWRPLPMRASGRAADATATSRRVPLEVRWVAAAVALGVAALLGYRWYAGDGRWQLLAHIDGLLAMSGLLAAAAWYVEGRSQLRGLAAFVLLALTLMLAWAICAAAWTYHPFDLERLDPVWEGLHLGGVYLGTISAALAAAAGATYLVAHHRMKSHHPPTGAARLPSLETLETLIVRSASLGFVLLTLGLAAGIVVQAGVEAGETQLGPRWWASPKVWLATAAWGIYAVLMNARRATAFRGAYAAWLSIAAMVLLVAVYGVATAIPEDAATAPEAAAVRPADLTDPQPMGGER